MLVLPPFAEELNKTRRMITRLALGLSEMGWRVIQHDLSCCGDSEGEFEQASWDRWVDEIREEMAALAKEPVWLLAVRAGALLVHAAIEQRPSANVLLWQPVLSGAQHLQQFLRLHTGARVIGLSAESNAATPAQLLRAGQLVEVGGYRLNPDIASGLERSSFTLPAGFGGRVAWLDVAGDAAAGPSPASTRAVERLQSQGVSVTHECVVGPAFWQSQEIECSEAVLQRSTELLRPETNGPRQAGIEFSAPRLDTRAADQAAEQALCFPCAGHELLGILSRPAAARTDKRLAVLIAVGGPQYRIGSHRQFVQLARGLAQHGFPALRFDYRGMGDSQGDPVPFTRVEPDLRAAVDALIAACPSIQGVVIWGLCDAASAALMFGPADDRVRGLVVANPWARSETTLAVATVKHYYTGRVLQREFWTKLLSGRFDWARSARSFIGHLRTASTKIFGNTATGDAASFQSRMADGLRRFRGRVLLLNSTNDLTASEFLDVAATAPEWRGLLAHKKVSRIDIDGADHTFSRRVWMDHAIAETVAWMDNLATAATATANT